MVFPENMGTSLALDETSLQGGELYTILTNKAAHGKKGSIVAIIKGTKGADITSALSLIPVTLKMKVKEVTVDLANTMDWVCRSNFMNAVHTADRFHVQCLVTDGVQEIRIRLRKEAREEENKNIIEAKKAKQPYHALELSNGDTIPQLLARSRYLLYKSKDTWTGSQWERASLLFKLFPILKTAYVLSQSFRAFFQCTTQTSATESLNKWYDAIKEAHLPEMTASAHTIHAHEGRIMNYFMNRETNASAESFNAKIKGFRALLRGIRDLDFFLFRLKNLYA